MKIINIVPGFGGSFYCGNCLRDSSYVRSLVEAGHDAVTLPIYLPLTLNGEKQSGTPVFYGAINIYLKQKFPFLRKMPTCLENFFNSGFLLKYAAKKADSTRAHGLEEMTISMLKGHEGYQKEELKHLINFLKNQEKPDIVHLSNALLMGLAKKIKEELGIPVVCSLQDEDVWIDAMDDSYQEKLWNLFSEKAKDVDAFIAVSQFYGDVMKKRMNISDDKLNVIHVGIDPEVFEMSALAFDPPVIGFMSRMNDKNGFDVLIDAYIKLKSRSEFNNVRLRLSGGMTGDDKQFIQKQINKLKNNNFLKDVEFVEEYKEEYLNAFFQPLTLLSVPVLKGEAFGLYQIESLACGVPLVQPALGAFPEIIEATQGGVTYTPNNATALANKLAEVLSNPDQLIAMSKAGRASIEDHFSSRKLIKKMMSVYERVVTINNE
ncbi:MAG: glycosyltransferase family 4 protein [Bacteroidetes bacterium]|nr:glycosyltransferase family 4 protein [Bacteroidota bacterium]